MWGNPAIPGNVVAATCAVAQSLSDGMESDLSRHRHEEVVSAWVLGGIASPTKSVLRPERQLCSS